MENHLFNSNKDQSITFKVNAAMKNMLIEKAKESDADLSKYLLQMIIDKFREDAKAERLKQEKIKEEERLLSEQVLQDYATLDKIEHEKKLDFNHTPNVVPNSKILKEKTSKEPTQTNWKELINWAMLLSVLTIFCIFCYYIFNYLKNKLNNKKIEEIAKAIDSFPNNHKKRF